ncbi:MAG: PepSY domain-containing protein, partial [Ignavibacteriaceae bacterium]
ESEALQYALKDINAESYMWENNKNESFIKKEQNDPDATMYPKGVLMLSAKNFKMSSDNFHLVYRFDIYAEQPMNRYYIDVDAHTGEIINKISRIQSGDVQGQGTSVYNGIVSLTVADTAITTVDSSKWHLDTWNAYDGLSWWAADPALGNNGGYSDGWYEGLDTDPISLSGSNLSLQFYHRYSVETPGGDGRFCKILFLHIQVPVYTVLENNTVKVPEYRDGREPIIPGRMFLLTYLPMPDKLL